MGCEKANTLDDFIWSAGFGLGSLFVGLRGLPVGFVAGGSSSWQYSQQLGYYWRGGWAYGNLGQCTAADGRLSSAGGCAFGRGCGAVPFGGPNREEAGALGTPVMIVGKEFTMKLINIGFGNMVSASRLVAIVSPESAPIKRIIQDARESGSLIDATYGRRTRAVIITDSDHIILSAVQPETVANRIVDYEEEDEELEEE